MRPSVKSKIIRLVALRYHKLLAAHSQHKKARRTSYPRQDYKNSVWWHFINKPTIQDPDHRDGKLFRTRFRVPYEVYKQLLHLCRDGPLAKHILQEGVDSSGRPAVPLELKLLGVLRVLGRASCFDSIAELTGTNEEVHRTFFHKFLNAFVAELCDVYICPPHSADGIARVMKAYDAIGFTGCIGSVDCVHIPWGRGPAGKSNLYTGNILIQLLVILCRKRRISYSSISSSL